MFPVTYFFFPKLTCRRGLTLRVLTGNLKPATRRWARCKPLNYGMASSTRESAPGTQTAQLPAFVHPFIRVHVTFSPMPRFKRPWIPRSSPITPSGFADLCLCSRGPEKGQGNGIEGGLVSRGTCQRTMVLGGTIPTIRLEESAETFSLAVYLRPRFGCQSMEILKSL